MELHSLLGQHPGSPAIEGLLATVANTVNKNSDAPIPAPTVKVYKDAVYYSYLSLGISLNYEPSVPLTPSSFSIKNATLPESSLLTLMAVHLYRDPADKFKTFPLAFRILKRTIESDFTADLKMDMKAHEVVQLLGEPDEKQGGGRAGNCWIGYQKSFGLTIDFAGSSWDDREMVMSCATLTGCTSEIK